MLKCGHFSFKNMEALWTQKTKSLFYKTFIIILMVVSFTRKHKILRIYDRYKKKDIRLHWGKDIFKQYISTVKFYNGRLFF